MAKFLVSFFTLHTLYYDVMITAMKIQISDDVKRALDKTGFFITSPRGVVDVKVTMLIEQFVFNFSF